MQSLTPKQQAELSLIKFRAGEDIDTPIEDVIKRLERPLTALEKIDIDSRTINFCRKKNEAYFAALQNSMPRQKYTSSLLGTLAQHELIGLMIFAGFGRKESQMPVNKMQPETQQKLYFAFKKLDAFIKKLCKHHLFTLEKFVLNWDGEKSHVTNPALSDLERQQELLKLSAHAQRLDLSKTDKDTLAKNRKRETEIREAWAEMEHEFKRIQDNPETRVNELQSARQTAIQHLRNWQQEAMHIFAMELIPLLENRLQELEAEA